MKLKGIIILCSRVGDRKVCPNEMVPVHQDERRVCSAVVFYPPSCSSTCLCVRFSPQ